MLHTISTIWGSKSSSEQYSKHKALITIHISDAFSLTNIKNCRSTPNVNISVNPKTYCQRHTVILAVLWIRIRPDPEHFSEQPPTTQFCFWGWNPCRLYSFIFKSGKIRQTLHHNSFRNLCRFCYYVYSGHLFWQCLRIGSGINWLEGSGINHSGSLKLHFRPPGSKAIYNIM